jgi:hypothetical protein
MPDFLSKITRPTRRQSRTLIALLLVAALAALALMLRSQLPAERQAGEPAPQERRPLPDDVEGVLTSFSYSEAEDGVSIKISGKRVVRRGRHLLGLRSNLVKTNFIENIRGEVRSPRGTTVFSAAQAEWDAEASRPLLLQKEVSLTVCGRRLLQVRQARIHLKSGVVEVNGAGKRYLMK